MNFDHVLLIGFGGPTRAEEVVPFLQRVTEGRPVAPERLEEVLGHYRAIGGHSPYGDACLRLRDALEEALGKTGVRPLEVFAGMRNWRPFLADTLAGVNERGYARGIGLVLAPHRCYTSFDRYVEAVEEAKKTAGAGRIRYEYVRPWFDHPLFVRAHAEAVRTVIETVEGPGRDALHVFFTAHSVPRDMAGARLYAEEFRISAERVAESIPWNAWSLAYQSRSGYPGQPWLGPDVREVFRGAKMRGARYAVLDPLGFLCENAEILFDLDIEARGEAEREGLTYRRTNTVMDSPLFVAMAAELIAEKASGERG